MKENLVDYLRKDLLDFSEGWEEKDSGDGYRFIFRNSKSKEIITFTNYPSSTVFKGRVEVRSPKINEILEIEDSYVEVDEFLEKYLEKRSWLMGFRPILIKPQSYLIMDFGRASLLLYAFLNEQADSRLKEISSIYSYIECGYKFSKKVINKLIDHLQEKIPKNVLDVRGNRWFSVRLINFTLPILNQYGYSEKIEFIFGGEFNFLKGLVYNSIRSCNSSSTELSNRNLNYYIENIPKFESEQNLAEFIISELEVFKDIVDMDESKLKTISYYDVSTKKSFDLSELSLTLKNKYHFSSCPDSDYSFLEEWIDKKKIYKFLYRVLYGIYLPLEKKK